MGQALQDPAAFTSTGYLKTMPEGNALCKQPRICPSYALSAVPITSIRMHIYHSSKNLQIILLKIRCAMRTQTNECVLPHMHNDITACALAPSNNHEVPSAGRSSRARSGFTPEDKSASIRPVNI